MASWLKHIHDPAKLYRRTSSASSDPFSSSCQRSEKDSRSYRPHDLRPSHLMIHVCIIGLGLIGGSLGMALRRARWKGRRIFTVHGGGRSHKILRLAKKRGAADFVSTRLSTVVGPADIVVLASPVHSMPGLTRKILASLKKEPF